MPGVRTYKVTLADEEQDQLRKLLSSGKAAARKLNHARILLYADESVAAAVCQTDQQIADTLGVGASTVARVRQRFVEHGFEAALNPRPRPRGAYKLEGPVQSQIIALAKSDPPAGQKRWTLRLLADHLVALGQGPFSHETVRQVLKKTR
jgi:transposase